jgi:hypothetical protein
LIKIKNNESSDFSLFKTMTIGQQGKIIRKIKPNYSEAKISLKALLKPIKTRNATNAYVQPVSTGCKWTSE